MAIPTNSFTTYNVATANQRDVSSFVTNVSPTDSPFFSMIGASSMVARVKENVTDTNTAANKDNALIEGDTFSSSAVVDRTVESNVSQIFSKPFEVTETQDMVLKYGGVKSEISYQLKKKFTEIATDVEEAFIQGSSATGATNVARKLSGLIEKITTNTTTAATNAALWTGTAAAELAAFEDLLNDMFDQAWETGNRMNTVLVGGNRKRRISKLTDKVTRNIDAEKKTQILSINVYDSDFGTMNIVLDRYVPDVNIIAVDIEMWSTAYLRRFKQQKLAKVSDGTNFVIVGELTLDGKTEKGAAIITAS
tara:strand:- start:7425 stop:8348 length:924 start_codon:yes stop_codon:yes gene_type:complete